MNQGGLEQLAAKDRDGRIPLHLAAAVRTPPELFSSAYLSTLRPRALVLTSMPRIGRGTRTRRC